jgi:IS5 family transposase
MVFFFNFELEKQLINRISFRKFIDFPEYITHIIAVCNSEKELLITAKKNKLEDSWKANLITLV